MPAKLRPAPQSKVGFTVFRDKEAEIAIGFRYPVRRVKREEFDLRVAMTADEAQNLYYRLGRILQAYRRVRQADERAADHVD